MFSILLICGGPSPERGISLNSARSVLDHLGDYFKISALYINEKLQFFPISCHQLYSNTPEDFDFKLLDTCINSDNLESFLKTFDLIFPLIHGKFGEDGQLQALLEKWHIPFIGSASKSCKKAFNKFAFNQFLRENDFHNLEMHSIQKGDQLNFQWNDKRVVKPATCGSSLGVTIVEGQDQFEIAVNTIFDSGLDEQVVVEEFTQGSEFTLVLLENLNGEPVPLIPTEVEILTGGIFDYRKKYLPSSTTRSHCPPRFSDQIIQSIRVQAKKVFQLLQLQNLVRIDGWVMQDGRIIFTDLNIMSGMEQNSFIFQQAAWVGLNHTELLLYIIKVACKKYNLTLHIPTILDSQNRSKVYVIFGGDSSEKEVSVMSGTNVWLKLMHSKLYNPEPFLLVGRDIWSLPYPYNLYHTVEEITEACISAAAKDSRIKPLQAEITTSLNIPLVDIALPQLHNLELFLDQAKTDNNFIFLALHGGFGEDGSIQSMLEERDLFFNGSNSYTSKVCINKYLTGEKLTYNQNLIKLEKLLLQFINNNFVTKENSVINYLFLVEKFSIKNFIIKPKQDGCSTGVIKIQSQQELNNYLSAIKTSPDSQNSLWFSKQGSIIQVPSDPMQVEYLIEPLIEVDDIAIIDGNIKIIDKGGWIEITVGVLATQNNYHALMPSITLAKEDILSLEEKFQGGTGINLTPPPEQLITESQIHLIQSEVEKSAKLLRIDNYARYDIFFNYKLNKLIIIEINNLPALTPSTVLFHQALVENPPLEPKEFLEKIIQNVFLDKNML